MSRFKSFVHCGKERSWPLLPESTAKERSWPLLPGRSGGSPEAELLPGRLVINRIAARSFLRPASRQGLRT